MIPSEWQQRAELQDHWPIHQHSSSERCGKDFLLSDGKKNDHLIDREWLHRYQLPEGLCPRFLGCVEPATMIWEQIQTAKREKKDLHVVWLNLANAYVAVLNQPSALDFFYIPDSTKVMVMSYFQDLHMGKICRLGHGVQGRWMEHEALSSGGSARGFMGGLTTDLLKNLGLRGGIRHDKIKNIGCDVICLWKKIVFVKSSCMSNYI